MRKALIFVLTLLLALGGLGYAHAAVTDQQDDLLIYPTLEVGDPSVLEGWTASMTFACGSHLHWYTDFCFGGVTQTAFEYSPSGFDEGDSGTLSWMDVYFNGGLSASVSGGSFSLSNTEYGALLKAVAAVTPEGRSKTMNLRMKDYVNYYLPDFELRFDNGEMVCNQLTSLYGQITGDNWYETHESYAEFFSRFRFPVQDDHIMSVTVEKDALGQVVGIELSPENDPTLYFISDVNAQGIWFISIFQDEEGIPLAYETPQGHGIYHAPWKQTGNAYNSQGREAAAIAPDMDALELLVPLDETLSIRDMEIDGETGEAWMLTSENTSYVLTAYDLDTGKTMQRIQVLPRDPQAGSDAASFVRDNGYLLVTAQGSLALVDTASRELLLTAPDDRSQNYCAAHYDPEKGDLQFDGEHLILIDSTYYQDGTFWTAVYRRDQQVYYGEYDCSIMRGNDAFYYRAISVDQDPIVLQSSKSR